MGCKAAQNFPGTDQTVLYLRQGSAPLTKNGGFMNYFLAPVKVYIENEIFLLYKKANSGDFWIDVFPLVMCHGFQRLINCLKNLHWVMQ